ncbi:MAG TPA: SulP family inorganic anion transporter [Roseateles sp.]|nr:SulP family inorganic anion transporter [Roseateles sp.]
MSEAGGRGATGTAGALFGAGLLGDLGAGTVCALVGLSHSMSYAALVFSGALAPLLAEGMATLLLGGAVIGLVVALRSTLPITIAGPDANSAAILAVAVAGIAAELAGAPRERLLATVLMALSLSALATGAIAYLLGRLRQGTLIQLMPHSVVAGFLAGTGLLICGGALRMLGGQADNGAAWAALRDGPWLVPATALGLAAALLALPRLRRHPLGLPASIVLGSAAFFALASLLGLSTAELHARGLLFEPPPRWTLHPPIGLLQGGGVAWPAIAAHAAELLAAPLIGLLTILLNSVGLELYAHRRVDADRELRAAGIANLLSGACGGFAGYHSISRSLLNLRTGARGRRAGVWAALCGALIVLALPGLLGWLPKPVLAGLLLYLGLSMLLEWAWATRRQLPRHEYLLVLAIFAVIAWRGFALGVLLGLLGACTLFAWSYGRSGCIGASFSLQGRRSRVRRSLAEDQALARHGAALFGLGLQGYLYFGTAKAIVARVEAALAAAPRQGVLIDMGAVQGLDASALQSFRRLRQCCEAGHATLAFAGLDLATRRRLQAAGVLDDTAVLDFPDLDHALEWSEERVLRGLGHEAGALPLRALLAPHFGAADLERLLARLQPWSLAAGETVYRQGERADSMLFIEQGRLGVSLVRTDGTPVRLGSYGPGTLVGELALFTGDPRSADVVAEASTRARRLSSGDLQALEREAPGAALALRTLVIQSLAARLVASSQELGALASRPAA